MTTPRPNHLIALLNSNRMILPTTHIFYSNILKSL